jgi:hypothetical protein
MFDSSRDKFLGNVSTLIREQEDIGGSVRIFSTLFHIRKLRISTEVALLLMKGQLFYEFSRIKQATNCRFGLVCTHKY